jgi:oligoribonuclease NrnB/cAMP/cGMP phosphodiesterase (DHH superfamily)
LIDDIGILKKKKRILSITHQQDVDGLFCGAILKNTFNDTLVYLTNYGYNNMLKISKTIEDNVSRSKKKGIIIISDLSIDNLDELKPIECAAVKAKEYGWEFIWIDHHYWNEIIKEKVQSFATLILSKDEEQKCAAEIIVETFKIKRTACQRMAKFAHAADFRSKEINKFPPLPEIIRYFLTLPDAYKKLQTIVNKASKGIFWDDDLQQVYESDYIPIKESLMQKALQSFTIQNIRNYKIAIVESPKILSKSIIAERIFELQKDIDLAIMFAPDGKLSIRRKPESNIKCDVIAQKLHGGGHSYAAAGVIKPRIDDDGENTKKIDIDDVIEELQKIL